MNTATIPAFAFPATPDALALFETIALAGLEGRWIRLSLRDQKRIVGAVAFGYASIRVNADDTLQIDHACGARNPNLGALSLASVKALVAQALALPIDPDTCALTA